MRNSKNRRIIASFLGFLIAVSIVLVPQRQYFNNPNATDFGLVVIFAVFIWGPIGLLLSNALAETIYGSGKLRKVSIILLLVSLFILVYAHRPNKKTINYCNGIPVSQYDSELPSECQ